MKPLFFFSLILILCAAIPQEKREFSKEELLGKINPSDHPDFEILTSEFSTKSDMYLRKEAYAAFKRMYFEASKCGISLKIISATRNFDHQKKIWDDKWLKFTNQENKDKRALYILRYSSMPGTSRHHWGTDIDINALNDKYFQSSNGKKEYEWLCNHAAEYGFYQPYTSKKNGRKGYEEEKWHWTYLPLSALMLEQYNAKVTYEDIIGFNGSETAKNLAVFDQYVNGVELPTLNSVDQN